MVGGFSDLFLRISPLDRLDHAAHRIEFVEVVECAPLHFEGQTFQKVRTTQRIDRLRHSRFISDDLLGAQRDACRFLGRQGQRFVVGVTM